MALPVFVLKQSIRANICSRTNGWSKNRCC